MQRRVLLNAALKWSALVLLFFSSWSAVHAQRAIYSLGLQGGYASAGLHVPGRDEQPNFTPVGQFMLEFGYRREWSNKRWLFGIGLQHASERQWATIPLNFDPNNTLPADTTIGYNATFSYTQHSIGREWAVPFRKRKHDNTWFFVTKLTASMNILYKIWSLPRQFTDYDVAAAPVDYVRIDVPSRRPDVFTVHPSMELSFGVRWQFARHFASEVHINGGALSQGFDFGQVQQRFHYRYGVFLGLTWQFWDWRPR